MTARDKAPRPIADLLAGLDIEARRLRSAPARAASIATKKSRAVKREAAIEALNAALGNVKAAARALGIARSTLQGHLLTWPGVELDAAGKVETLRAWAERTWPRREWDARYGARDRASVGYNTREETSNGST